MLCGEGTKQAVNRSIIEALSTCNAPLKYIFKLLCYITVGCGWRLTSYNGGDDEVDLQELMEAYQQFEARFSPGGLRDDLPCVYVLSVDVPGQPRYYVGRTGTLNKTGQSSPFKRLATHLTKRGNTQSALWEKARCLRDKSFENAPVHFAAIAVPPENVVDAEKWLCAQFEREDLINENPSGVPPDISDELKHALNDLMKKLTANKAKRDRKTY